MKNSALVFGALLWALTSPAMVAGQASQSGGWAELLASRTRIAYRNTHPEAPAVCPTTALPTSANLISPTHKAAIGRTWLPGPNQSRWDVLTGPARADTIGVRVVELWCGPGGPSVLVESGGFFLEIAGDELATVDENGEIAPGLLATGGPGSLAQLMLEKTCDGEACTYALRDAELYALVVRAQLARQLDAQRQEWEEASRSLQALGDNRQRASSDVRSRAAGFESQNLIGSLQRLGVTEAQARAIMERRVIVGMNAAMVRAALGEPQRMRQETTAQNTLTIWAYPGREIHFSEGLVSQIR